MLLLLTYCGSTNSWRQEKQTTQKRHENDQSHDSPSLRWRSHSLASTFVEGGLELETRLRCLQVVFRHHRKGRCPSNYMNGSQLMSPTTTTRSCDTQEFICPTTLRSSIMFFTNCSTALQRRHSLDLPELIARWSITYNEEVRWSPHLWTFVDESDSQTSLCLTYRQKAMSETVGVHKTIQLQYSYMYFTFNGCVLRIMPAYWLQPEQTRSECLDDKCDTYYVQI